MLPAARLMSQTGEDFYSSTDSAACYEHVFKWGKDKKIWMLPFSFRNCSFIEMEMFHSVMTTMLPFFASESC